MSLEMPGCRCEVGDRDGLEEYRIRSGEEMGLEVMVPGRVVETTMSF